MFTVFTNSISDKATGQNLLITEIRTAATPARGVGRADVIEKLRQPISGVVSTHLLNRACHALSRNVTLPVQHVSLC